MPRSRKDVTAKGGNAVSLGKTADANETFGEALSRAGFEPAKVGRRAVSQGKRREMLKKHASKDADK